MTFIIYWIQNTMLALNWIYHLAGNETCHRPCWKIMVGISEFMTEEVGSAAWNKDRGGPIPLGVESAKLEIHCAWFGLKNKIKFSHGLLKFCIRRYYNFLHWINSNYQQQILSFLSRDILKIQWSKFELSVAVLDILLSLKQTLFH